MESSRLPCSAGRRSQPLLNVVATAAEEDFTVVVGDFMEVVEHFTVKADFTAAGVSIAAAWDSTGADSLVGAASLADFAAGVGSSAGAAALAGDFTAAGSADGASSVGIAALDGAGIGAIRGVSALTLGGRIGGTGDTRILTTAMATALGGLPILTITLTMTILLPPILILTTGTTILHQ